MIWVLIIVGVLFLSRGSGTGDPLADISARLTGILNGTPSPNTQPSANTAGAIGVPSAAPPLMPYVGIAGAGRAPGASGNLWPPTGQPLGRSLASGASGSPWLRISPPGTAGAIIGWRSGGS
jgi:hypothetical protein